MSITKKRVLILSLFLAAVAIVLAFMLSSNGSSTRDASPKEVATQFLTVLFTNDYQTLLEAASKKIEEEMMDAPMKEGVAEINSPTWDAFLKEVKKGYSPYVTDSCMEALIANRTITSFSKLAKQAGAHISVSSIDYEQDEVDKPKEWASISFVAHLHITYDDGREPKDIDSEGIVNLKKDKKQWKINTYQFYANNVMFNPLLNPLN